MTVRPPLRWRLVTPEEEAAEFAKVMESHHRKAFEEYGTCFACVMDSPEHCVCDQGRQYLHEHDNIDKEK